MKILEKTTILKIVEQCKSEHDDIEVIDYTVPDGPFVSGTCYYDGIVLHNDMFDFNYSMFSKLFPIFFSMQSMTSSEYIFWRSLMALCLIKGYRIILRTHADCLGVIEVEHGHYLSMIFELTEDKSSIDHIIGYDEINCFTAKYRCYEHVLDRFLFPLLNDELKEFGMSVNSIDDLNNDNLLIFSALSI